MSNLWLPKTTSLSNTYFNRDLMNCSTLYVQATHSLWFPENVDNRGSLFFVNKRDVTTMKARYSCGLFHINLPIRKKIKPKPVSMILAS